MGLKLKIKRSIGYGSYSDKELHQYLKEQAEITARQIISEVDNLWKPTHHNLCYGIDIEPHLECICCKWLQLKRDVGIKY